MGAPPLTEWADLLARRRMTRDFTSEPVAEDVLDRVLAAARRGPAAGNTDGTHLLVLSGAGLTGAYWDATLPVERRDTFAWPGLLRAPVLVVVWADPSAYLVRYAESDKAASGLGAGVDAWPVPYWTVDASFAAMLLQLTAIDEGLGVCFFGLFDHADAVRARFGVPASVEPIGTIALGHPGPADRPGRSADRRRTGNVHLGEW